MTAKYRVYRENGKFFAEVSRRKYWLFGPWVTDIYENRSVWWKCVRTGKEPSLSLYYALEKTKYWSEAGES